MDGRTYRVGDRAAHGVSFAILSLEMDFYKPVCTDANGTVQSCGSKCSCVRNNDGKLMITGGHRR